MSQERNRGGKEGREGGRQYRIRLDPRRETLHVHGPQPDVVPQPDVITIDDEENERGVDVHQRPEPPVEPADHQPAADRPAVAVEPGAQQPPAEPIIAPVPPANVRGVPLVEQDMIGMWYSLQRILRRFTRVAEELLLRLSIMGLCLEAVVELVRRGIDAQLFMELALPLSSRARAENLESLAEAEAEVHDFAERVALYRDAVEEALNPIVVQIDSDGSEDESNPGDEEESEESEVEEESEESVFNVSDVD